MAVIEMDVREPEPLPPCPACGLVVVPNRCPVRDAHLRDLAADRRASLAKNSRR